MSIDNASFSAVGVVCPNILSHCQLTLLHFLPAGWSVLPAAYPVGPFRGMVRPTGPCFLLAAWSFIPVAYPVGLFRGMVRPAGAYFLLAAWSVIPAAYPVGPFRGMFRPAGPCFLLAHYAFIGTAGRFVRKEQAVGGGRGCFWRVVGVKCFQDKTLRAKNRAAKWAKPGVIVYVRRNSLWASVSYFIFGYLVRDSLRASGGGYKSIFRTRHLKN